MYKRVFSAALAALVAAAALAAPVSAEETAAQITGDAKGTFKFVPDWDAEYIYFYVWDVTADPIMFATKDGWTDNNTWASKKTRVAKSDDGSFESFEITFPEGHDFNVIFYDAQAEQQTFDCVLGPEAIGDTAEVTGERLENPADSAKSAVKVKFKNSGLTARKVITSTGEIQGETITKYMNPAKDVAAFVLNRLGAVDKSGKECVTEETVANAIKEFDTNADAVWAEYQNLAGQENYNPEEAKKVIKPSETPAESSLTPEEVESLRDDSSVPTVSSQPDVTSKTDSAAEDTSSKDASSKETSSKAAANQTEQSSKAAGSTVKSPQTGYSDTAALLFITVALLAAVSLKISAKNKKEN